MKNTMEQGKISSVNLDGLTCDIWLKHLYCPCGQSKETRLCFMNISQYQKPLAVASPSDRLKGEKGAMSNRNFRKAKAIESQNKKRLLRINPDLTEESGIYFLTRTDEEGIRYAYIGQAKHILTRLAQHLVGYQHIDLSLKTHGLYDDYDSPYGWRISALIYPEELLDEKEQQFIKQYAMAGYQLRNKTSGSQGAGKKKIDEYRPQKGYHDGLAQGRKNLARELSNIIDKHLIVCLKPEKQNNKISIKALEKFNDLLGESR